MSLDVKEILVKAGLTFVGGKIEFPDWCKRVSIDVGLSSNAPQSSTWLENDPNLLVLGFEPIPSNVRKILAGESSSPRKVNPALIGKRMFVIPVALGNPLHPRPITMFETKGDAGCSSILSPVEFEVLRKIESFELSLDSILEFFPWEKFPTIEYLKTDCQGYDLHVIRGVSKNIHRIKCITSEIESIQYENPSGNLKDFREYIEIHNFNYLNHLFRVALRFLPFVSNIKVKDPTWIKKGVKLFGPNSPKIFQEN